VNDPSSVEPPSQTDDNDPVIEEEDIEPELPQSQEPLDGAPQGEGEDDEEIDDEEMIDIAENCLIKIAEALLAHNVSI
jgi:hypothetical protein